MSRYVPLQQVLQSALLLVTVVSLPIGIAASSAVLAQAQVAPRTSQSIIDLPAPRVEDYWISATRQPGGALVFDGYAPDEATRDRLAEVPGADVNWLKLGSGAPELYDAGLQFGIKVLERLGEGRFAIRQNIVTLSGVARSGYDHDLIMQSLAGLSAGLVLARAEIALPEPAAYSWSASKSATGEVLLSGSLPTRDLGLEALSHAGPSAVDQTSIAPGAPSGFGENILAGLDALQLLRSGTVRFDGTGWSLTGELPLDRDETAVTEALDAGRIPPAAWSLKLAQAPAPRPQSRTPAAAAPAEPRPAPTAMPSTPPPAEAPSAPEPVEEPATPSVPAAPAVDPVQSPAPATSVPAPAQAPAGPPPAPAKAPAAPTPPPAAKPAAAAPTPAPSSTKADLTACRATLAEFSARNSILFSSGAARIAPESEGALDELAGDLAACPEAVVHIEGYTDSEGDDRANLALSVARAEAVVDALILRRISPDRLYAVGYGESNPIADNATAEGRRLNRRIVVTIPE